MALPEARERQHRRPPDFAGLPHVRYHEGDFVSPFYVYEHRLDGVAIEFWDSIRTGVRKSGVVVRGLVLIEGVSKDEIGRSVIILSTGVQESRHLFNKYKHIDDLHAPIPEGAAIPFQVSSSGGKAVLFIEDGEDEVHKRVHKAFERYLGRNVEKKKIKLEKDKGGHRFLVVGRRSSPTVRL